MEEEIIKFRNDAIPFFREVLLKNGYDIMKVDELAFYIVKILEDSFPLIQNFERKENDFEKITDNIHLLFTNLHSFEEGKKLLMWEK